MHKSCRHLLKSGTCNQEQDREVIKFVGKETSKIENSPFITRYVNVRNTLT